MLKRKWILTVFAAVSVTSILMASLVLSSPSGLKDARHTASQSPQQQPLTDSVKIVLLSNDRGFFEEWYEYGFFDIPGTEGVRLFSYDNYTLDLPFSFNPRGTRINVTRFEMFIVHDFLGNNIAAGGTVFVSLESPFKPGIGTAWVGMPLTVHHIPPQAPDPLFGTLRCQHRVCTFEIQLFEGGFMGESGMYRIGVDIDVAKEVPAVYLYEVNIFIEYTYFR